MRRFLLAFAGLAVVLLALPIVGLLQRMPWSSLPDLLGDDVTLDALRVSLVVSLVAALVVLVLGTPLAWALGRTDLPGRRIVRALVVLPMVLPPVVGGAALLFALGRRGLIGQWLDRWFGLTLPFTLTGAILAATFVALPFYVIAVEGALRTARREIDDLEGVASTLGAPPLTVLRRITLPRLLPAMGAGLALAWARALGEFGATITFAGNLPGRTQTLPLATFLALQSEPERALALSLVMLAVALAVLLPLRDRWLPGR
ncbi:MAG: molybdate ABC transporter permease subunit [Acidimicrobiales bacterium]|jgi:molybdate transport system permease protein|nr:molybdate ABC transporter permease subunit [Actinomycetes bacterium]MDP6105480.1 molybdate ABC transporter permease subunit [Acidimicrobiales bacterium]MCP4844706.1 molybdate ABC transporter permease subunit [Actinomycetes bacterium]MDP6240341.1 molybdate ABC transporter permease subunit [Acidimicrobiales bacterium]MDP7124469.1 molybdate ABC transporter permease subunit [Acidimicrobiales bacterium]|tara:strand:- start:768 stop:1547 length:780 start_codon:yes stop_codon:yes gene_type:complete